MTNVTHYKLEFNPNTNNGRIQATLDGSPTIHTIPINSSLEFICVSLILQTGRAHVDQNGTLSCSN